MFSDCASEMDAANIKAIITVEIFFILFFIKPETKRFPLAGVKLQKIIEQSETSFQNLPKSCLYIKECQILKFPKIPPFPVEKPVLERVEKLPRDIKSSTIVFAKPLIEIAKPSIEILKPVIETSGLVIEYMGSVIEYVGSVIEYMGLVIEVMGLAIEIK